MIVRASNRSGGAASKTYLCLRSKSLTASLVAPYLMTAISSPICWRITTGHSLSCGLLHLVDDLVELLVQEMVSRSCSSSDTGIYEG